LNVHNKKLSSGFFVSEVTEGMWSVAEMLFIIPSRVVAVLYVLSVDMSLYQIVIQSKTKISLSNRLIRTNATVRMIRSIHKCDDEGVDKIDGLRF